MHLKHSTNIFFQVENGELVVVSLIIDEMSIMKQISFDRQKYVGGIDLGEDQEDQDNPASEALVFLLVAVNNNWKIPCDYFLINGLNSSGKS